MSDCSRLNASGLFWATARPEVIQAITRHNERVGSRLQRFLSRLVFVYMAGIAVRLAAALFLRLRVEGRDRLRRAGKKVILAPRHYYEWDPLLTFSALYPDGLFAPRLLPISIAGHFWMRSKLRRTLSWLGGVLGVVPGEGPDRGAIARAARLFHESRALTVAIFPTGPIRRARSYEVRPGVGYLAGLCPDVPVVPVTVLGVADLRLGDVLRLRRPEVVISFGEPICARSLPAGPLDEQAAAVCDRIAAAWEADKARLLGRSRPATAAAPGGPALGRRELAAGMKRA